MDFTVSILNLSDELRQSGKPLSSEERVTHSNWNFTEKENIYIKVVKILLVEKEVALATSIGQQDT